MNRIEVRTEMKSDREKREKGSNKRTIVMYRVLKINCCASKRILKLPEDWRWFHVIAAQTFLFFFFFLFRWFHPTKKCCTKTQASTNLQFKDYYYRRIKNIFLVVEQFPLWYNIIFGSIFLFGFELPGALTQLHNLLSFFFFLNNCEFNYGNWWMNSKEILVKISDCSLFTVHSTLRKYVKCKIWNMNETKNVLIHIACYLIDKF